MLKTPTRPAGKRTKRKVGYEEYNATEETAEAMKKMKIAEADMDNMQ